MNGSAKTAPATKPGPNGMASGGGRRDDHREALATTQGRDRAHRGSARPSAAPRAAASLTSPKPSAAGEMRWASRSGAAKASVPSRRRIRRRPRRRPRRATRRRSRSVRGPGGRADRGSVRPADRWRRPSRRRRAWSRGRARPTTASSSSERGRTLRSWRRLWGDPPSARRRYDPARPEPSWAPRGRRLSDTREWGEPDRRTGTLNDP